MEGYEALVLAAEGDGVGPSLLLSPVAPLKGPQYLFNCPEGFARLAIEHKVRPSGQLAAVFLTSLLPQAAAGLPGLFLRLAVDGHEKLETCGPPGTGAYVHAQRHIVHWVHPRVTVSQASSKGSPRPIFQDGRLVVLPIFEGVGKLTCPCCLEGGASEGLGKVDETGQEVPVDKGRSMVDLSASESEVSEGDASESDSEESESESESDDEGARLGEEVQSEPQVRSQVVQESNLPVGAEPVAKGAAREKEESDELADLSRTRPPSPPAQDQAGHNLPIGGVGERGSEGGSKSGKGTHRAVAVANQALAEGVGSGVRDEKLAEEGEGRRSGLGEGTEGRDVLESGKPDVGKSNDLNEAASDSSESDSGSEDECDRILKGTEGGQRMRMGGPGGRPPRPPPARGAQGGSFALFAQLDSIFMAGGAGSGAMRQKALSTLTVGPLKLTKLVTEKDKEKRGQKKEARKRDRGKLEAGGMKEQAAKVEQGRGVQGLKRQKKVIEIDSSGEAVSVEESVEVDVMHIRSDVGRESSAECTNQLSKQKGNSGAPRQSALGSTFGASALAAPPTRGGDEISGDSCDDEGECLTQLLSPALKGRGQVGTGPKEALFAQLDDIFNSEGSAEEARNEALHRLGRPRMPLPFSMWRAGLVTPATDRDGSGIRGQGTEGKSRGGRGAECSGGRTEAMSLLGARTEGAQDGAQTATGEKSGAALPESAAEASWSGRDTVDPPGGLRLRGGGPTTRGLGRQQNWGRNNGGRGTGWSGMGIPGAGSMGAGNFVGGGAFVQHQEPFAWPYGRGKITAGGPEEPPRKKHFRFRQDSNSEDSDTWQEEAHESGMHWLLGSSRARKERRLLKHAPAGGAAGRHMSAGGGGARNAPAGGPPPRPKQRIQVDTHTPSSNPVFLRTPAGILPVGEGLGVLQRPATGGTLLGYLCFLGPPVNGSVLMMDCRSKNDCERLDEFQLPECVHECRGAHRLTAVFHFTSADVAGCQLYRSWVGSFGAQVRHVMLSDGGSDLGYRATYQTLVRLNLVDKEIFPLTGNANGSGGHQVAEKGADEEQQMEEEQKLEERKGQDAARDENGEPTTDGGRGGCREKETGGTVTGGLLARVSLCGRQPSLDAPAQVDKSKCLGGVDVEGIQAQVLEDQPALAYWKAGGNLEEYEAEREAGRKGEEENGTERQQNEEPKGEKQQRKDGVTDRKEEGKRGGAQGENGVVQTEGSVGGGKGRESAPPKSGIERNATQAELIYERQLAEQQQVLQQQWHFLTPTLNKAQTGLDKPATNPTLPPSNPDLGQELRKSKPGGEMSQTKKDGQNARGPVFDGPLPQVIFLGTGSAEPSKYRGGSAILLTLTHDSALLMDCGEGAAGQLFRTSGLVPAQGVKGVGNKESGARARSVARSIRVVWVSHKHADHCLGVLGVLQLRGEEGPELLVLGPVAVETWLKEVQAAMQENGQSLPPYIFRHCREFGSILNEINQLPVSPAPANQPPNPALSLTHTVAPAVPASSNPQRPTLFGQQSRASNLGPGQHYYSENLSAGYQQQSVQGPYHQYFQHSEQIQYHQMQQPYTQPTPFSGAYSHFGRAFPHAHVQSAPSIAQTLQTPQQQAFGQAQIFRGQCYAPPINQSGHSFPNQYNQYPGKQQNVRSDGRAPSVPTRDQPPNSSSSMLPNPKPSTSPAGRACAPLNLSRAQAVPVHHCADSWGLVIHHHDGWSLVYSGDTRPTRPLIEAGRGCTLLIHEATFEGKLLDHARRKRHSTTEEALDAAAQMGAHRTILTHFSQRYPKAVEFESNLPAADSTCIAFDGMVVPFSELGRLPSLLQPIRLALADVERAEGEEGG